MINSRIVLRLRDGGIIEGVLHSLTPKSAWMLIPRAGDPTDEFVNRADIAAIDRV